MVKIRLRRVGTKKKPQYRLVVADARSPRDGAFIDIIGHYNPLTDPKTVVIAEDKARHWLERGAEEMMALAKQLRDDVEQWLRIHHPKLAREI
jgi:small subunit ribosomal protein S16